MLPIEFKAAIDYYVLHPPLHALVAVTIPFLISMGGILHAAYYRDTFWRCDIGVIAVGSALGAIGSFYQDTDYHVLPVYPVLAILVAGWRHQFIHAGLMYAGTFVSTLIPDLFAAWDVHHSYVDPVGRWYYGIGLSEFADALFVYPTASILAVPIANKRIRMGDSIEIRWPK
ncbi:hypothetical protein [Methylocaldum sp.]|jgi:hypothetical protein|uniref:hypothetical protein n=1 Tax=Methylocaldum sp. TaxID=1969727 RepID=UPI00322048A7